MNFSKYDFEKYILNQSDKQIEDIEEEDNSSWQMEQFDYDCDQGDCYE